MFSHLRRITWKTGLLGMVLSLLGVTVALAASGGLDLTFSGDGKQTTDFGSALNAEINGIAMQSDGKILAAGYVCRTAKANPCNFAVARYDTKGNLDKTFSGDGKQFADFGATDVALDVAIQPLDGKIVVSGRTCGSVCRVALTRYNADGSLDTTFNGTGRQVVSFGTADSGSYGGLAINPTNGKIIVGGYTRNSSGDYDFALYRFMSNGSLDTSFSGDGKYSFGFGMGTQDYLEDLRLQGDKVVVAGYTCNSSNSHCDFAVSRVNPTGALDALFNGMGKQITDFGAEDRAYGVALQTDGKVVVAGQKHTGTGNSIAVVRYTSFGHLDTTFNGTGKTTFVVGTSCAASLILCRAESVVIDHFGQVVVAGTGTGIDYDFVMARLRSNGTLDTSFGTVGKARFNTGGSDRALALVQQADDKYVLGGSVRNGTHYVFALARVLR